MRRHVRWVTLILTVIMLLGCSGSSQKQESNGTIEESPNSADIRHDHKEDPQKTSVTILNEDQKDEDSTEESVKTEEIIEETADPVINRPVITLKRDMYYVDEGLYPDGFDNIASITDVEDGELVYEDRWYGGLTGEMVNVYQNLFLNPHDRAYEFFNPGRKIILTSTVETQEIDGFNVHLIRILAYDSDGNMSYADYHATEIPNDNASAVMTGMSLLMA